LVVVHVFGLVKTDAARVNTKRLERVSRSAFEALTLGNVAKAQVH
jgi:hypothetical protein